MGVRGVYHEVTPPLGFVCTESFDGADGETLNTVRFLQHGHGCGTTIISTIRYPSVHARQAALASQMRVGLGESLDRLGALLQFTSNVAGPTGSAATNEHQERI